jgi:hypothetical protein
VASRAYPANGITLGNLDLQGAGLLVGINLIFWGVRALLGAQLMRHYLRN